MRLPYCNFSPYGPTIVAVIVPSACVGPAIGDRLLAKLQPHFPTNAIMLVSIEDNGFRAYSTFQNARLLALLQLEMLEMHTVDLSIAPAHFRQILPF